MKPSPRIEDTKDYDPKTDFTCVDCGGWITKLDQRIPDPKLCMHCIFTPGWFRDPKLREIFDPKHSGEPYTPPENDHGKEHA